jgi:hypothetical protein
MPCVVTAGWLFSSAVPAPPRYPSPNSNECGIDNHCSKGRGIRRRDDAAEPCSESTAGHTGRKRQYGMQRWHPNNPANSAQHRRLCHRPPGSAGATATSRSGSGNLLTPDRCCNSRHHFPFLYAPPVALPDAAALRHCTSCDLPIERGWLSAVRVLLFPQPILANFRDGDMVSGHLVQGGRAPRCWRIIAYPNSPALSPMPFQADS